MTLKSFKPLTFGSEDINLHNIHDDDLKRIKDGLNNHQLVLLKKQQITMSQQISFTKELGKIEFVWEDKHPDSDYIQLLQNKPKKYKPFKSTSKHWHTDRSFINPSSKYTILYAKQIEGNAGGTEFCNLHQAYMKLSDEYKRKLTSLNAIHSFDYKFPDLMRKKQISKERISTLKSKYPDVIRPLIKTNSASGTKSIFLSELCLKKIIELNEHESSNLLKYLYDFVLNPELRYVQEWEEGDVLIWDNESLMHRALGTPPNVVREFHRTTTMIENS